MMEPIKKNYITISQCFEEQAKNYPDKIAVQSQSDSITYSGLNTYANQIAHKIMAIDNTPLVGTYFDNNIDSIAAILGILKSGRTYIPLNPRHNSNTIKKIIEDSRLETILTEKKYSNAILQNVSLIETISKQNRVYNNPDIMVGAGDPCCVIYTSGSTGEPKGVLHNHRNVLHTAEIYRKHLNIVLDDKILLLSHCSFAASMANTFASLISGATTFIFDIANTDLHKLPDELIANNVTVFHSVPTVFLHLADLLSSSDSLSNIRLVLLGGEPVHYNHIDICNKYFPATKEFVVVYGATEAIGATFFSTSLTQEFSWSRLPIGYPVDDFTIEIVDSKRNLLPQGKSGEIRIVSEFASF